MKKSKKSWALTIMRFLFVILCLGGFLYQTAQFLFLYWTYPTVVDIQQIEPSYLEFPAFTICNSIGYNFDQICRGFTNITPCLPSSMNRYSYKKLCKKFPEICFDGDLPQDFQAIFYTDFMKKIQLRGDQHDKLRIRLEEYMSCSIEFAGEEVECNLENVMGSFYSKDDLPQYCYSIYSLWGQPQKKRELVAKGAVMHLHFELNSTFRPEPEKPNIMSSPKHNPPSNPNVQIAVHSPYFLPSPYLDGMNYIGGRAYELRLQMSERHLLSAPYQTNCTDYMKLWYERGGKSPITQMGIVQECRVNKTYNAMGCIPLSLDYPHNYTVCSMCPTEPCNYSTFAEECGHLSDSYNQPCDSISYITTREDRVITTYEEVHTAFLGFTETLRKKIIAHDCEGYNVWTHECGTIDVYVLFDRFEITNLTYNPKFESLELFSVIGGYMGMWLGISLLNVYDFIGSVIVLVRAYAKKRRSRFKLQKIKKQKNSYFNNRTNYRNKSGYNHGVRKRGRYNRTGVYDMW